MIGLLLPLWLNIDGAGAPEHHDAPEERYLFVSEDARLMAVTEEPRLLVVASDPREMSC